MADVFDEILAEIGNDLEFSSELGEIGQETFANIDDQSLDKLMSQLTGVKETPISPTVQRIGEAAPGVVSPTATPRQAVGQALTTPIRGVRGLAVGAERITRPIGLASLLPGGTPSAQEAIGAAREAPVALGRAAEAVQPGFQPEDTREAIASTIAEIGAISLFATPLGGLGVAGRLGQILRGLPNAIRNSLIGASAATITSATDKGDVDAIDIGTGAFVGGAALPLAGVSIKYAGRLARTITRLLGAGVLKNIRPASVRAIEQTSRAQIMEFFAKDPTKATRNMVLNVQARTLKAHTDVSNRLNQTRAKIGIGPKMDEDILTAAPDFVPDNQENMTAAFRLLTSPAAKRTLTPEAHLRQIIKLKQDLASFVSFNKKLSAVGKPTKLTKTGKRLLGDEQILRNSLRKLDRTMQGIPGGREQVNMNRLWSASKKVHDSVTQKLLDANTGPAFLQKTILGENIAELALPRSDLATLRKLERRTGVKFIEQLKSDLALLDADDAAIRGNLLGVFSTTAGARNTALALRGGEIMANLAQSLSNVIQAPITAAAISSAILSQRR